MEREDARTGLEVRIWVRKGNWEIKRQEVEKLKRIWIRKDWRCRGNGFPKEEVGRRRLKRRVFVGVLRYYLRVGSYGKTSVP